MTNYTTVDRHISKTEVLMDDGGNPPARGERVTINGKLAEVTASAADLLDDSRVGGRFLATWVS